jgi:hypothetical protein
VVLTAAPVDLGGTTPVELSAQLAGESILLHASGSAALARIEELSRAAHLSPRSLDHLEPQGTADFDVTRTSKWQGSASSASGGNRPTTDAAGSGTSGTLRLHNARYTPDFLPGGVDLPVATATFSPGEILWNAPGAVFHQIAVQLTAHYPLSCPPADCVTSFRASFGTLDTGALGSALLGDGAGEHLLDALLSRLGKHSEQWPALSGSVHADTLTLGRLAARNANATLSIAGGHASIENLDAQTLGGSLNGQGGVTVKNGQPHYALRFALMHGSAAAAGNLFDEEWGGGQLNISSDLHLGGVRPSDLLDSAEGTFHAEWIHGGLGLGTPLSQFARWTGDGQIGAQALTFTTGTLAGSAPQGNSSSRAANGPRPAGAMPLPVFGRITFNRTLALEVGEPSQSLSLSGTLSHPIASTAPVAAPR